MGPNSSIKQNILLINPFDFLGESFVDMITTISRDSELYLVAKNPDVFHISKYGTNPNVSLLSYQLFFQNPRINGYTDLIIYNALTENGQPSELLDYSHNFRKILEISKERGIPLLLLVPIYTEHKADKKFDYISSLTSLAEEFEQQGTKVRIIRFGEIYGPGMDLNAITPLVLLLQEAVKKPEIVLEKDPAFRYYIYIQDALAGLLHIIENKGEGDSTLAQDQDISIASVAVRIGEILGKKVISNIVPLPHDHIKTAIHTPIKWKPLISLEEGLEKTLLWIKNSKSIKNAESISIYSVSPDPTLRAPIRNYTPKVSVFREVPDKLLETPSAIDAQKTVRGLRNIEDIRSRAGVDADEHHIGFFERMSTGIKNLQDSFTTKASYNKEKQYSKWKGRLATLLVVVILIILIPFFVGTYDYIKASESLQNTDPSSINSLVQSTSHLEYVLPFTRWVFSVTKQNDRYVSLEQTIATLNQAALAQLAYEQFSKNQEDFISSYQQQDPRIKNTFAGIDTNTRLVSDLFSTMTTAEGNLSLHTTLMPPQAEQLKLSIHNELKNLLSKQTLISKVADTLQGTRRFIIVVETSPQVSFDKKTISHIYTAGFTNGIYQGLTDMTMPQNVSGSTISSFSVNIENSYGGQYDGVFVVSNDFVQNMIKTHPDMSNGSFINNVIKYSMGNNGESLLTDMASGIRNKDVDFYLKDTVFSSSDLLSII